jgi:hypothetical protein
VGDRGHGAHHSILAGVRDRVKVFGLLMPPSGPHTNKKRGSVSNTCLLSCAQMLSRESVCHHLRHQRFRNILRNDRAKDSFHWVLLPLTLLGSGVWLLAPHIRPEEVLLDQPIELPKRPDGAASKPALDEASSVSHKILVAATVRL